ncbi:unnamed protein product [Ilex paraguariensis]|uniref:Amidase domain-containing protein n=1 Tax=Ilex paraguariensis TaxID=185542 RepID=A0ABC8RAM9_9AQUA
MILGKYQFCDLKRRIKLDQEQRVKEIMARDSDYGAFMEKFVLQPSSSSQELPLSGLTFAVKDIFDVDGYITGFGNPEWARTHSAATSTAVAVLAVLKAGATCVGTAVMDEMAYREVNTLSHTKIANDNEDVSTTADPIP